MNKHVYVFVGFFESRETACQYTEPQWEAEPDESVSDEEYRQWEACNASWQMRTDLDALGLDSDFIETIFGDERFEYLGPLLTDRNAVEHIRALSGENDNTLVLIFAEALGGFPTEMKSTPRLTCCGRFECEL